GRCPLDHLRRPAQATGGWRWTGSIDGPRLIRPPEPLRRAITSAEGCGDLVARGQPSRVVQLGPGAEGASEVLWRASCAHAPRELLGFGPGGAEREVDLQRHAQVRRAAHDVKGQLADLVVLGRRYLQDHLVVHLEDDAA